MAVQVHNISIKQGQTFEETLNITSNGSTPIDITGFALKSDIRQAYYLPILGSFTIEVVNAVAGQIKIKMAGVNTYALHVGALEYDIFYKDVSGVIIPILKGSVTVEATDTNLTSFFA